LCAATANVSNTLIQYNTAHDGGAIALEHRNYVYLYDTTLESNTADNTGGMNCR
jgi:hypothetical protein